MDCFYVQCCAERASSPAPQRERVERSIAARGASLNVWSRSHRFESVERIIFAVELVVKTRAQLRLLLGHSHAVFRRVEGITSASSKRSWQLSAGHRVNVPAMPVARWGALSFALSPWLGLTSRGTMTQIMREIVKVGVRGSTHVNNKRGPVRAIVEGVLFLSARSSFLPFPFPLPLFLSSSLPLFLSSSLPLFLSSSLPLFLPSSPPPLPSSLPPFLPSSLPPFLSSSLHSVEHRTHNTVTRAPCST